MALSNLTKVQTLGIGSNIEVVGVITTGQFKSGTSNLHSTGVDLTNLNVSGIATIGGNVSIGGTLTYQDVTNIDSVGLITARAGVNVSGGQLDVGSNIKIGTAGVITATSLDISGDIDVDGHTNLDNVSIVGVTTFNGLSTNDVIRVRAADTNGISVINILAEGTTGHSRIKFSDTAGTDSQISYTHTDRALTFATAGTTERLRIRSDGRLLLGTTSANHYPDRMFTINRDAGAGIELRNNSSSTGQISFSDTSGSGIGAYRGYIQYQHNNGSMHFATQSTERLRISSDGYVTKPTQASFSANSSSSYWTHGSSTGTLAIDNISTELFDIGGNYNHSTSVFTAPVAGKYFFSLTYAYVCTSGYLNIYLKKGVGGTYSTYGRFFVSPPQQSAHYTGPALVGIMDLAAGNTVRPMAELNYAGNQLVNLNFSGYLLG